VTFNERWTPRGRILRLERVGKRPLQRLQPLQTAKNTPEGCNGQQRLCNGRGPKPLHRNAEEKRGGQLCNGSNGRNLTRSKGHRSGAELRAAVEKGEGEYEPGMFG
jgi:hypothetical protein